MSWPHTFGGLSGSIPLSDLDDNFDAALQLAGGTMTGDLTLKGDPTAALIAAPKQYVDAIGRVIQQAVFTDDGSADGTTSTTLTNITGSTKNFTPKIAGSTVLVSVSFQVDRSNPSSGFAQGAYQLHETTAGLIGKEYTVQVFSGTSGFGQQVPAVISAILTDVTTDELGFLLYAAALSGTPAIKGTNQVWSITEISA